MNECSMSRSLLSIVYGQSIKISIKTGLCYSLLVLLIGLLVNCAPPQTNEQTVPREPLVEGQIAVELKNSAFTPNTFKFNQGQSVEFVMYSQDVIHTFTVVELDINWEVPPGTDSVRKEFTFDKVGQYELICIIYGHKRDGMYGTILIE